MAQGKQTPRQKMINLMYLVFIAMMALNIDAEIIRSYYDSTQSLKETRLLTQDKNTDIFEVTLKAKAQQVPDTYEVPLNQYNELKGKIDDLVSHADVIKDKLMKDSEFVEKDEKTGKKIDVAENFAALNSNEAPTSYFFKGGDETIPSKEALDLKAKMDNVRNYINKTFGGDERMKKLVERANKSLIAEYGKEAESPNGKTWFQNKFFHQPLIAALSNLEIIQNDARNVQSDALALMLQEKVDASVKFNTYEPIISGPTDIQAGKTAEIKVMLGAISNSNKINISGVSRQENGIGIVPISGAGLGERKVGGTITLTDATGQPQTFPWTHTYNVIAGPQEVKLQQGLILTADKMNVVYRGLENPMSGSILGADNAKLSLSATNATIKPAGNGKWMVIPGTGKTVQLRLSGTDPHGRALTEVFEYRIKNLPQPQGQVRGKPALSMPASSVVNQVVTVALPDFDFPVSFQVKRFMVRVPGKASTLVEGDRLSGAETTLRNLRDGDVVGIFGIEYTVTGLGSVLLKETTPVIINVQ